MRISRNKLKRLEKIYSPKRDKFKLAEKPDNTISRLASSSTCRSGSKESVIGKIILKIKNLKNLPACVFSICGKCKLMGDKVKPSRFHLKLAFIFKKSSQNKYYSIPRLASSSTCRSGPEYKSIEFSKSLKKSILPFYAIARLPARQARNGSTMLNPKNIFKIFCKKIFLKKALALITIITVIIMAYFQNAPNAPLEKFSFFKFLTGWTSAATFGL